MVILQIIIYRKSLVLQTRAMIMVEPKMLEEMLNYYEIEEIKLKIDNMQLNVWLHELYM